MSSYGRPRTVQMARRARGRGRVRLAGAVTVALVVVAVVVGASVMSQSGSGPPDVAEQSPVATRPAVAAAPSKAVPSPSAAAPTARPSAVPSPSPEPEPSATPRPSPAETLTTRRSPAPRTAAEFDVENQVIDIGFPLKPTASYRYRDNWLERRHGEPYPYNHASVADDGRLERRHDGIDIYGPEGAVLVAPFDGRVIDPSQRWTPWDPDRYGLTVVIESGEQQTEGYTAMLVHLDRVSVAVGDRVSRGTEVGMLGRTGNTGPSRAHLHFELRAPFKIDWAPLGENRSVDAFNPFPSLRRADPQR